MKIGLLGFVAGEIYDLLALAVGKGSNGFYLHRFSSMYLLLYFGNLTQQICHSSHFFLIRPSLLTHNIFDFDRSCPGNSEYCILGGEVHQYFDNEASVMDCIASHGFYCLCCLNMQVFERFLHCRCAFFDFR